MRNCSIFAVIFLACTLAACSQSDTDTGSDANAAFHDLLDEHWAAANLEKVFFRKDPDAWRMDGALPEHTPKARARRLQFNDAVLSKLAAINID